MICWKAHKNNRRLGEQQTNENNFKQWHVNFKYIHWILQIYHTCDAFLQPNLFLSLSVKLLEVPLYAPLSIQ